MVNGSPTGLVSVCPLQKHGHVGVNSPPLARTIISRERRRWTEPCSDQIVDLGLYRYIVDRLRILKQRT